MFHTLFNLIQFNISGCSAAGSAAFKSRRFVCFTPFLILFNLIFRGVAQLVARLLWEQDAAGSSPVTPTSREPRHALSRFEVLFIFWF